MKLTHQEQAALLQGLIRVFGDNTDAFASFEEEISAEEFSDGNVIYANDRTKAALGIIIRGGAEIVRARDGCEVYLRSMQSGNVFGAALLFSDEKDYVTEVRAKGKTRVVFLPEAAMERLFTAFPKTAIAYIAFLTEKIRFLNRKIATFTAGSATEKLFNYLKQNADANGVFAPSVSYSRIADALGLGRASLYRAIDELCAEGIIRKEQKNIILSQSEESRS